ncbi:3-hydroxyacyl-CoA dehydrogenase/enoyl-CoA hydratase family protein [Geosporobacter ferrireducens]|uniref:3-hydroxybutyryl-CoA dehydrogenase n=1 Tax=Geosporobacter ferrireducens TaxID=1424294 RepID=A0A1D8GFW8_9FIRM|nr:3-hydroxyacyl-CoA dehydrogenase/enoyl-CoA hydratase family protein [Geosporobacter ferrireducens]AOT69809.1 3-hydroxyacyl-CoA dehydrogenase [Geosporobacter ferrireducens]
MSKGYKVGVVGAGNMGAGIAQKMAQEGLNVHLVDMNEAFVERGISIIRKMLQQGVDRNVFTADQMEETLSRIKGTVSYEDLADMDLIVEAVFEDKTVKGELFKRLDKICDEKTILATNTSSFYVSELAQWTNRPDRVVGMHYFFHPAKNRLLEVIPHEGTSKETLHKALLIGKLHGKTNIVVKDAPGFAVNRFFVPFLTSSVRILEEGIANIPTIEDAAKKAFAIGMGPFELMNVTGIPIAAHASNTLGNEFGDFYATPELLNKQSDSKELWDLSGEVDQSKIQEVMDFLYGAALGVACQLVEEGVASIEDTDRGAKIGLRWRFGPFELMNRLGIEKVYDCVKATGKRYPSFRVPNMLIEQCKLGKPFEFKLVDLEIKGDIAYITINRPEAMNALNPVVVDQLEEKFSEAESNENIKAIAIQGAGKAFIAGADIKFFIDNIKNDTLDKNVIFTRKGHELLRRFETSPKRTIAVVDGLSLGGGSELALACQTIVATQTGSFGFPETGIGIYPGLGGMLRMARHVGPELAKYYVFTGKTLKAEKAYEMGVVTALTDPAKLEETIIEVAKAAPGDKYRTRELPASFNKEKAVCAGDNLEKIMNGELPAGVDEEFAAKTVSIINKKAPIALRVANELIDAQAKVSIDEAIELELERLVEIFSTKDALSGLTAPVGKPPKFENQ